MTIIETIVLMCSILPFIFIIYIVTSKRLLKLEYRRRDFYTIERDFNDPNRIYIQRNSDFKSHTLFLKFDNHLIKIDEYIPGNLKLALTTVELYLKEIYKDKINNIKCYSFKYNLMGCIEIDYSFNTLNKVSTQGYTKTHNSFDPYTR